MTVIYFVISTIKARHSLHLNQLNFNVRKGNFLAKSKVSSPEVSLVLEGHMQPQVFRAKIRAPLDWPRNHHVLFSTEKERKRAYT